MLLYLQKKKKQILNNEFEYQFRDIEDKKNAKLVVRLIRNNIVLNKKKKKTYRKSINFFKRKIKNIERIQCIQ